jgi:hypothetical protein
VAAGEAARVAGGPDDWRPAHRVAALREDVVMAVYGVELLLRRVAEGRLNGLNILPYERHGDRQPWQRRLTARILSEVGHEDRDVVHPGRHGRR